VKLYIALRLDEMLGPTNSQNEVHMQTLNEITVLNPRVGPSLHRQYTVYLYSPVQFQQLAF
jgi:hypothetical protein